MNEVNKHKTKSIKELGQFSIDALVQAVHSIQESEWNQPEDFELNYNKTGEALKHTKHLTLRFINKQCAPYEYLQSERWNFWNEMLLPLMNDIVSVYGYKKAVFPKIMFANLPSGCFIPPHVDGDKNGYVAHKIHVPIMTNDDTYFFLEDKRYHFEVGKAYEVNNGLRHAVANNGSTDRIHLIFECLDYDLQPRNTQKQMLCILD